MSVVVEVLLGQLTDVVPAGLRDSIWILLGR